MYIFICEWNVFLLKLLEASSFSWSVMFSEVWSSWLFQTKLTYIALTWYCRFSQLTPRILCWKTHPGSLHLSADLWMFLLHYKTSGLFKLLKQTWFIPSCSKTNQKTCQNSWRKNVVKKKAKTARLYNMSAAETIETHAKALTDTQCSFPVRRYQQPQHEGLSQTRVCVIYN